MSTQALLLYIFGIISALYVTHFGIYLTGANLYDIWQFKRRANLEESAYQPLMSVLIPAHNEEKVILRCLRSIRKSTYKNFEVFVIDDASHDRTYQLARQFAAKHPDMRITALRKRVNVGKANALNHALRNYVNGELVMTLDADSLVLPDTLRNAVSYFEEDNIVGVAANVQIIDEHTVLGVLQKFEHMIGYRSKKIYSLLNCEFVIGGVASTYRMNVLRETRFYDTDTLTEDVGLSMKVISRGNISYRVLYGVDVVAMTEGVATFRALVKQRYRWKYGILQNLIKYRHLAGTRDVRFTNSLVIYRLPMAFISEFALLFAPIIWGYVLYTTLSQQSIILIAGAYLTITVYTLITIWFDEHLSLRIRLHLTFYAPIAYFLFYVMDIVQLIAIIKCIGKAPTLLNGNTDHAVWISPERIGREISIG
jgi:cellulose synthase/poly-beta-1,6-N-acetylglucosamine synthase-like glycosyltransferase